VIEYSIETSVAYSDLDHNCSQAKSIAIILGLCNRTIRRSSLKVPPNAFKTRLRYRTKEKKMFIDARSKSRGKRITEEMYPAGVFVNIYRRNIVAEMLNVMHESKFVVVSMRHHPSGM
jgi:hypothetical protein